jgi:hypothetical protein
MATTTGVVTFLRFGRGIGEVGLREEFSGVLKTLHLYAEPAVKMIDPTEMVRRNWMFGLLQRALTHGLCVSVVHSDEAFVQEVILQPRLLVAQNVTSSKMGTVIAISLLPTMGTVTFRANPTFKGGPVGFEIVFYIYSDVGSFNAIAIGRGLVESAHRNRVIRLLQQALADGLPVTLEYQTLEAQKDHFIVGAILHSKESLLLPEVGPIHPAAER